MKCERGGLGPAVPDFGRATKEKAAVKDGVYDDGKSINPTGGMTASTMLFTAKVHGILPNNCSRALERPKYAAMMRPTRR